MRYNIITPMARFDNYKNIKSSLLTHIEKGIDIHWHILIDDDSDVIVYPRDNWISAHICANKGNEFWTRCNNSINWFLDYEKINPNERYMFLNDDDSYEDDFFLKINKINEEHKVIICSMLRGTKMPVGATGYRAHPTNTLIADKKNMIPCSVGIEQIIITGSLLKNYRLPIHVWGDGMFIQKITEENETYYEKDSYVLFNFFEKGRWE